MLGLVVSAIVVTALAAFATGVGQGWTASESAQSVELQGIMATDRIDRVVRAAKMFDSSSAVTGSLDGTGSPATLMLWANDDTTNDGKIQFSEMAMLQFDSATNTLREYYPNLGGASDWTASPAVLMSPATFTVNPYVVSTYKILAHNVIGCQLFAISPASSTQKPSIEYVLKISNGNSSTTVYQTCTLRGPNTSPN